jgi:AcrR family transcriptional regulator
MTEIRSRIELLQAMAANYEQLLGFVRTATVGPDGVTDMTALVENLERTVPGLSVAAFPSQASNLPTEASRPSHGIMNMISRASMVARKEQVIDGVIERTDALTRSLENVRTPLTEPFRRELSAFSLDIKSLDVLRRQQSRLTDLVAEIGTASPPIAALMKQQMLLSLYRSHLAERRSEIQVEGLATWKALIRRLVVFAATIAMVLGTSLVVRRLTGRYGHESDRRQMLQLGSRVLFWLITLAVVLYAFAFDLSSVATFLGLLSAGLAVGLHDVLLAIGGH